jgi:hypothetical protein
MTQMQPKGKPQVFVLLIPNQYGIFSFCFNEIEWHLFPFLLGVSRLFLFVTVALGVMPSVTVRFVCILVTEPETSAMDQTFTQKSTRSK